MKLFKILLSCFAAVCIFDSCETNLDNLYLNEESKFVAPSFIGPGEINITDNMITEESAIKFEWSAADFGQPVEIRYDINASYNGKSTVLFARLNGTNYEVKCPELAEKLLNLGIPEGEKVTINVNMSCTIGTDFTTLKSAEKSISVFVE